ncbi:MAG: 8-oxo-dGTP diphosphatase [Spirochaetales bacterium]|nr:MAG: 8-oxo-dGTP diphosphatase [Spirochaetales bacterium]
MQQKATKWADFRATESAVIAFALRDHEILLIHKKRGLGQGKINGPGGRVEEGETPMEAAVRETWEEVGLVLTDLTEHATIQFTFTSGYCLTVKVFVTTTFSGILRETEEADPFWHPLSDLPFDRMWADDRIWLPHVLRGAYVHGRFLFDDDRMIDSEILVTEPNS